MDDEQYRQTRAAIEEPRCLYEKALQYGYFSCRYARKIALGEREAVHCSQPEANARCHEFYTLSLQHSGFALGTSKLPAHLTFNKAMKVQIGGLTGAMQLAGLGVPRMNQAGSCDLPDVSDCLVQLQSDKGTFDALNYSRIVPCIQEFSLRKRRRERE